MAMASVKFHDYSIEVKNALAKLAYKAVEESCGAIQSQTVRNTGAGKSGRNGAGLKNSWRHTVLQKGIETIGTVGSPLEYAIWYELGTGEYALENKGRKGGWYIPIGEGKGQISEAVVKAYKFKVIEVKGKKYAHTYGMKPRRPLFKAYSSLKNKLINRMQDIFKGGLS
jgi:hypothetical protein